MALVVTIAGTDRTSVVEFDNLTVTQVADSYTFTCEVTLFDVDSDITITAGSHKAADEITLVDGATTYFGGFIDDIDFTCLEDGSRRQHLHCVGYGVLLGETTVEYEEYDSGEAARTDKWIINDIFTTYLTAIDASTAAVVVLADPLDILFEEMTVDEIMTAICNRTGGRFYVDNSKVLHYFSAETADAGFDLSDTPDEVNSFAYRNRPEKARTGGHIINKARIIGADGFAATRNDATSQTAYGIQGAIVTDNTLFTDAELNERGDDVLNDNKDPRDKFVITTTHAGAVAGDKIDFKCVDLGYNSTGLGGEDPLLVIREMHIRWEQGDPVYQMTLGELEYSGVSKSKSLSTQVKSIVLALGKSGHHRWGHNLAFSATDHNTVAWTSGVLVSDDGNTVYNIVAGNSGNMDQTTYIYLEPSDNITTLKNATSIQAIFANKNIILVATCHPVAAGGLAEFQVLLGGHATPGGTAVHDHSDDEAGSASIRPDKVGVAAAVPSVAGAIALAETSDPANVAGVGMLYCKDAAGTTKIYLRQDDGTIVDLTAGVSDHGALTGLADDDHTQYLLATGARAVTGAMTTRNLIPDQDARTLGDATHTFDLYTEVVAHYGATGANIIVMPDNLADGLHFADLGTLADHYLTFVTANAQRELVVNQNAADIDFRVEGVGDASLIRTNAASALVGIGCDPTVKFDTAGVGRFFGTSHTGLRVENTSTTSSRAGFQLKVQQTANAGDYFMFSLAGDLGLVQMFLYDASAPAWHNMLFFDYLNDRLYMPSGAKFGFGTSTPGSLTEWNFATENLEFVNAGSAAATEQDWIEVQVGGNTGYIRVFAAK